MRTSIFNDTSFDNEKIRRLEIFSGVHSIQNNSIHKIFSDLKII